MRGTGSLLSGPPAPPACGRPPPPWDPSGPHSRGVRRCPPHLHPLPARAPPVTPARAHSLRPGHPAKQQLAVGMGGEAGVEAGMCAGGEGRGPSEGAEVGEGPVERRPDENRGRPRWEERQAERLREAEGKRERGRRQSQRRGAGQTEATRSRTVSGEASRGSAAPGDSGPAPTHGRAAHLSQVTPEDAGPLPSQGWTAVGGAGVMTPGLGASALGLVTPIPEAPERRAGPAEPGGACYARALAQGRGCAAHPTSAHRPRLGPGFSTQAIPAAFGILNAAASPPRRKL